MSQDRRTPPRLRPNMPELEFYARYGTTGRLIGAGQGGLRLFSSSGFNFPAGLPMLWRIMNGLQQKGSQWQLVS